MAGGLGAITGGLAGAPIGGATVALLLNKTQFEAGLTEAEAQFKGATTSMGASSAKLGSLASAGFNRLALGAGIAVAAGVNMAVTFQKTFAQIGVLAGKLGMPMDQAKAHVLDLAKATGQDPNGLASALYFAASAGLQASQVMPVLDASAKAAAMGMGDAQTVAQTLTSVLNAYKGTGLDTGTAMNIMTAAVKDGKAEMSDFASGLGPIISVAANAGVSFQDLAAGIAEATNQGVPFARAVTGFRFLIQSLMTPTAKATTALQSIGLSAQDVAKMLTQPGGLEKAIQTIHDRTATMGEAGRQAWSAITGGARGSIVAIDLVGKHTADTNRIVQDLNRSAQKGATDFADAWRKISQTDAVKFQQALVAVKTALIQLGEKVLPELGPLVTELGNIGKAVIPLSPLILGLWAAFKGYTILKTVNTAMEVFAAKSVLLGAGLEGIAGRAVIAIAELIPFIKLAAAAYAIGTVPTAPRTDPAVVAKSTTTAMAMIHAALLQGKIDYSDLQHVVDSYSATSTDAANAIMQSMPHYAAYNQLMQDIFKTTGGYYNAALFLPPILEKTALASKNADQAQKGLLQSLYGTQAVTPAVGDAITRLGGMTKRTADTTMGLTLAQYNAVRAMAAAQTQVAGMSAVLGANLASMHATVGNMGKLKDAYQAWGDQVGQTFNDVENNLAALAGDNKTTFADMQKAVLSGMKSMKTFGQNIHTITQGGSADAKSFASYLVSLGPAGEQMAADLAAQPPKVRASFEKNFAASGAAAQGLGATIERAIIGSLTHVEAEVLVAEGKFKTLQGAIDALHGKDIHINVIYNTSGSGAPGGKVLP
jgi:TP901 family phage tail tape measure protein